MTIDNVNDRESRRKFTVISLFAGAGGLDMGFENKGFELLWANDIESDACATHAKWSKANIVLGDINKIDFNTIPSTDIIIGGFPCQGFSLAGPRKLDDKRNSLYKHFVRLVEEKQPYAFVAENVKGILTLGDGAVLEAIIEDFSLKGYTVFPNLINASDYGVPQDRFRVILIGIHKDLGIKTHTFPKPFKNKVTLEDALKNIPAPNAEDICRDPFSSRYMSRNRKRKWTEVSYTIPAMSKQVALHPSSPDMKKVGEDHWEFGSEELPTRRLSWTEAAAIQTFPPDMQFVGNLTSKYRQIGNAVPVKLAEVIAEDLRNLLEQCVPDGVEKKECE